MESNNGVMNSVPVCLELTALSLMGLAHILPPDGATHDEDGRHDVPGDHDPHGILVRFRRGPFKSSKRTRGEGLDH